MVLLYVSAPEWYVRLADPNQVTQLRGVPVASFVSLNRRSLECMIASTWLAMQPFHPPVAFAVAVSVAVPGTFAHQRKGVPVAPSRCICRSSGEVSSSSAWSLG